MIENERDAQDRPFIPIEWAAVAKVTRSVKDRRAAMGRRRAAEERAGTRRLTAAELAAVGLTPCGTKSANGRRPLGPPTVEPKKLSRAEHRARQRLLGQRVSASVTVLLSNHVDLIHGEIVTNRHEKRAARAAAKKYRCTLKDGGAVVEHGKECPKWSKPEKAKEVAA